MKTKFSHLILFFLLPILALSQSFSISGNVKDVDNNPISYANTIILKVSDSIMINGAITNEKGQFIIESLKPDKYIFKSSFLGFKPFYKEVTLDKDLELDIVLEENTEALSEVEVMAKNPTLKRESDRLIFNVESTSLTEGSIWDVLKSTPGVLMMNDEIKVKNSSRIIYLINGKRVHLSGDDIQQLLTGNSASTVQTVEVITNPPAKYDADGDAVINIKMSKNLIAGYNGSIYNNYTQGVYPRNLVGTSHYFHSNKISLFAGYSFDVKKINRINDETINFKESGTTVGTWNTDVDRNTKSKSHNANINFDYAINSHNTLSLSGNAGITPYWKRDTKSFTQAVDSTFSSMNNTDDDKVNLATNIDYVYESDKGSKLSFNLHHTNYEYDRTQDVVTDYRDLSNALTNSNTFNTLSNQDVKIYSGQVDVSLPITDGTFDIGFKTSNISSKSDITQTLTNNNSSEIDLDNSGLFDYNEDNVASYVSLEKSWEKWELSLGLRTEYTKGTGNLISSNSNYNKFDYLEWFPTFSLLHYLNENNSLAIGYNRRIERPNYTNLNPFKFYFNDNVYVEGNPNLQPSITQIATLTYTIKDTYTFEAYYRIIDDGFTELLLQDNVNNQMRYLSANLNQNTDFGLDFSTYTALTDNWSTYAITSIFKDKSEFFDENSNLLSQTQWSFYGNWINYFSFLEDDSLSADLSVLYISPTIDGPAKISSRSQIDFGIKKSFANDKWIVSLRVSDIFLTSDFTVKNQYSNQDNQYYAKFDNRWVRLGLRYKFGNTKLQTNDNIKELEERERLKNNH